MRRAVVGIALTLHLLGACKSPPVRTPQASPAPPPVATPAPVAPTPAAPAPLAPPRQVRVLEGVTEYALGNGMQVLLFPDDSKDTVTINVTILVGSRHEGYGETGMAHLLEHMLFKGSKNVADLDAQLKQRGATYNASTWYDRTNYFETMPANADNVAWALQMEADRMMNAFIRPADLASEFSVVRNEMESGENNPASILEERLLSTAYLWHNYGKSTIGARSDVERVQAHTLRRFYEKYYQPDNAVLVVAGKFDAAQTLATINATFGAIPKPTRTLDPTYTIEPVQDGERTVMLRRVGDVGVVGVAYHTVASADPAAAAGDALDDLLTAEPSGRLYQALVATGLAARVYGSGFPARDPSVLMLFATVPAGKPLEPVKTKLLEVVEGLAARPITEAEVARYRAKRKKQAKQLFANTQVLATQLSEYAAMGDWRLLFLSRDRDGAVTRDQVARFAATYLKPSNRTLGMFVPEKAPDRAPLTTTPDVAAALDGYQGAPPLAEGEAFVYTVANIEQRTTRGKLASGLAWAMLPKETRADAVRARLTLRFGTAKDFTGKVAAAELLGAMLRRGTKRHTYQELNDQLDLLEASVGIGSAPGELTVSITTTRDNLAATLTLVDEMLRQPAFPAAELAILRKESLAALEEARSQPQALAFNTLQRKLQPKPPTAVDYVPTFDEQAARTKAMKLADLTRLHGLLGASHAQFTVLGDFDAQAVEAQLATLWGGWRSPRPYARIADRYVETPGSVDVIDTPDKENAMIGTGFAFAMRDDDPAYPALLVANYVLGGSGFGSRLMTRLRERDGLSYGAGSFVQVDPLDQLGVFNSYAILAPQNAAKGMAGMIEELERFVADGVTAEELAAARTGYVKTFERNLSNDGFVLGQLHQGLFVGRTLAWNADVNARIGALTRAQVNAVVTQYFVRAKLIQVTGADQQKAAAAK